jgi:hypothetical protein
MELLAFISSLLLLSAVIFGLFVMVDCYAEAFERP